MRGYAQFSLSNFNNTSWDLVFPQIQNPHKNIFELVGTVLKRKCCMGTELLVGVQQLSISHSGLLFAPFFSPL